MNLQITNITSKFTSTLSYLLPGLHIFIVWFVVTEYTELRHLAIREIIAKFNALIMSF